MNVKKGKKRWLAVAAALLIGLSGCSGTNANINENPSAGSSGAAGASSAAASGSAAEPSEQSEAQVQVVNSGYFDEADLSVSAENAEAIELKGDSIDYGGTGAAVKGSVITITSGGTYLVSGTLEDGQLLVDCGGTVRLIFDNVNITSSTASPLKIVNSEKTVITLAEGSDNTLRDAEAYGSDEEATACLFSKQDLTFNGTGKLTVYGNYNDGITCKDTLKIVSGTFEITSKDDGIIGRDLTVINDGRITVHSQGDGIKGTNNENSGNIIINGGTLDVTAGNDGIQAVTNLSISGGTLHITTGGGSAEAPVKSGDGGLWNNMNQNATAEESSSLKGLKADGAVEISGGEITVDSCDDAVHSNGSVTVTGGVLRLSTGDDGIHADEKLYISGGKITVDKSYEGFEGAEIIIDGGELSATASDDGINAAGGNDGSGTAGFMGGDRFSTSTGTLTINGGTVTVNAGGDGLDANGNITMTGGTVIVDGPESGANGALDFDGSFNISGGTLMAGGSTQMAQVPSDTSSQYSIYVGTNQAAGTEILLKNAAGETVLTYTPGKRIGCVVFSSPELVSGETYTVTAGGETVGECTVSSAVNTIGSAMGGVGGMGGGRGPGGMEGGPGADFGGMPGGGEAQ